MGKFKCKVELWFFVEFWWSCKFYWYLMKSGLFWIWKCLLWKLFAVIWILNPLKSSKKLWFHSRDDQNCEKIVIETYSIVANLPRYKLGNQLFVKRSEYIRIENPLHKQSEKTCMFFWTRHVRTRVFAVFFF